jgi:membrane protease YdiL (CAAX protease family)
MTDRAGAGVLGRHPIVAFVALTYLISWVIWVAMALTGLSIETTAGGALNVVALSGPSIAAVAVAIALGGGELGRLLSGFSLSRLSVGWALVAVVLPLAMAGVAIAVSVAAMGGATPVFTAAIIGTLLAEWVRIVFLGGPLGEEIGWRGFALPRMQARRSAFTASLMLGLIWGLWHIPLYFVSGTGQAETIAGGGSGAAPVLIGAFVVWTMGLSVLFTWLYNDTRGSLIVAILFHASVNLGAFLPGAIGSTGAASSLYALVTWVVALLVVWRYSAATLAGDRGRVTITHA